MNAPKIYTRWIRTQKTFSIHSDTDYLNYQNRNDALAILFSKKIIWAPNDPCRLNTIIKFAKDFDISHVKMI